MARKVLSFVSEDVHYDVEYHPSIGRFVFFENDIDGRSECILHPFVSSVRVGHWKNNDTDYFKKLFEEDGCMVGEQIIF